MTAAIYGHRGARGERPENTLESFRHAATLGIAGIETDIAMTADLIPVLHHDPALPDGRFINTLSRADIPQIPTLAEALAAVPDTAWLLELKTFPPHPGHTHPPALMVEKTLAALPSGVQVKILAFDWEILRETARQAPAIRRICLTAPPTETLRALWWGPAITAAATPAAVAQCNAHGWAARHETLTPQLITQARSLNLEILAWTINTPTDFNRLAPAVDAIITDHPSRFAPARG